MSAPFIIRPARPGDESGICAAHIASIRGVCARDYTPEQVEAWCEGKTPALYESLIAKGGWYVAETASGIVGLGAVEIQGERAEVKGLYIAPQVIGQGVGAALLRQLLADARAAGATSVFVKGTTTAEPFYRRAGFVLIGASTHRTRGGVELPSVAMEMPL